MVAINMEMPSCCAECELCINGQYEELTCALLGEEWEETDYNSDHRDEKCPLIEIGTCKDCKHWCHIDGYESLDTCRLIFRTRHSDFYCADFEKRGNENGREDN